MDRTSLWKLTQISQMDILTLVVPKQSFFFTEGNCIVNPVSIKKNIYR